MANSWLPFEGFRLDPKRYALRINRIARLPVGRRWRNALDCGDGFVFGNQSRLWRNRRRLIRPRENANRVAINPHMRIGDSECGGPFSYAEGLDAHGQASIKTAE
jgi:hypothetical protein